MNTSPGQPSGIRAERGLISSIEQFDGIQQAIDSGDCPNSRVPWLAGVHTSTRRALIFRPRCKSWQCPVCGAQNAWKWAFRANDGAHQLYDGGAALDFVAVTSHEKLTPGQSWWVAPKAWMKLQARARRKVGQFEYFSVPELQKNGRVHFHLITTAKLSKRWWKDNARECGFGFQSDREEVWSLGGVVGYMSKYLVKSLETTNVPKGTRRVRTSRGWPKAKAREPPDGWYFFNLPKNADLNRLTARFESFGYEVAMKGSKSSWRYVLADVDHIPE